MSGRNCVLYNLLLFSPLIFVGCAARYSPPGWLDSPREIQTGPYGGWLHVKTTAKTETSGELIAIGRDSIFVANETLHAFALIDIESARLEAYGPDIALMGGWLVLGTLSSASNGWLCVFTGPMWILGGGTATILRSYEPILEYPDQELSSLLPFARFPQGLPTGIDRRSIKMKPGG